MNINRMARILQSDGCNPSTADIEKFVSMLSCHESRIRRLLNTLLYNKSEVDELFQRTSLVLWAKFNQFRPDGDFGAWACQIARFEVRNFLRTKNRDRHRFSDETLSALADSRTAMDQQYNARQEALSLCLGKLGQADSQIIQQCYGHGVTSLKEIAQRLGRTPNALYKSLDRIRRALLVCMKNKLEEV